MFYLIYKITNKTNGKFYIGAHRTQNIDDGYMGSGKLIKKALSKYGVENFEKEILLTCQTEKDMYEAEKSMVQLCEQSYNLKYGGEGGWDHIRRDENWRSAFSNKEIQAEMCRRALLKLKELNEDDAWRKARNDKISKSNKGKQKFLGKTHTDETKRKIGVITSICQSGSGNSQYGTCWISHELFGNKKCKKDLLSEYLEQGWVKGRNLFQK